ncbi:MAG: alpha/beta hydrolase [Solirubrobacterales bacterium]
MRRGWKIAIGALAALVVVLVVNALVVDGETKSATVTVPGGRILKLSGGEVQVIEQGPRNGSPIVLLHCYTCAIDWWNGMLPALSRRHRVVAIDLRGHGGSEKPETGYSMAAQASLVDEALQRLHVEAATVVGHSLGATVTGALAEAAPRDVKRIVIIDQAPDNDHFGSGLPFTAELSYLPVIGPALWQITPDAAVKDGLGVAFAPDYDVPDRFVTDLNRMTYNSYSESPGEETDYLADVPLDRRVASSGRPLLAIFGSEDQLFDSGKALAAYAKVPGAETASVPGAGHSPNVEKPAQTARLVLKFAKPAAGP